MLEVNEGLNKEAVDDTFNIQLDLFNRTKLSYIPEAMVAYRINEGSDSRPVEMKKITNRNQRLSEYAA
jgi:glucosyltransferase